MAETIWHRDHVGAMPVAIRRRPWGDFQVLVNYKTLDQPAEGYTVFEHAKKAADAASGCPQPCGCSDWEGPAAVAYVAGDRVPLVCHICGGQLAVSVAGVFVGSGSDVPHDADHASYTLECECGQTYIWQYWLMPQRVTG